MTDAVVQSGSVTTASRRRRAPAAAGRTGPTAPPYVFWMLVVFLVLEYVRPPGIVQLKLQFLISLILPVLFLSQKQRPWSTVLTVQVLFMLWCAKSVPFAYNYYAVYFTSRTLYGNVAIAITLTWVCSHFPDFRRIMWLYMGIMVYQAIWSLGHGGTGTGGFLGDENDLALACITAFPLAFFGFERFRGRERWLSAVALALLLAGVVASLSRGGFVGLVVCATYCWLMSRHKLRALVLVAVAIVLIPLFAPSNYVDEIKSISQTNSGTAKGRRFLWEAAFNMWKAHPVFGVGGGNVSYLIGRYQPTDFEEREYNERDWSGTTVHSFYFQLLPEQGIVGVAMVGFLIWSQLAITRRIIRGVRGSRRAPPRLRRDAVVYAHVLNGALLGYLSAGAFLSVAYYPYLWYFTALAATLDIAVRRELRTASSRAASARRQAAGGPA